MKRGGGNRKGGAFERAVCKRMSLWLSDHERDDVLWRTPMSGGRYTNAIKRRRGVHSTRGPDKSIMAPLAHAGDVQATHQDGVWFIETFLLECKFYKAIDWAQVVAGRKSANLSGWWRTTKVQASRARRQPFLVMKANHQPELVGLTEQAFKLLSKGGDLKPRIFIPYMDMVVIDFDAVLFLNVKKLRRACDEFDEPTKMKFGKPRLKE